MAGRPYPSAPALFRAACIVLCAVLTPRLASAQAEDQAAARTLFNEGRELLKAERYVEACPKFEAARRLYASAGIVLNLGDCYERVGRTASAWTEFGEAIAIAQRTGRIAEAAEAAKRQAAIEPTLSRLVVRVAHPAPGLLVWRDGAELPSAAWGASMPVDPGPHDLRASAPGRETWSSSVTIPAAGRISVDVPELGLRPTEAPPRGDVIVASDMKQPESTAKSRTLEWVLIGGGAVVGLAGGALMIVESVRAADARTNDDPAAWDSTKVPWVIGLAGAAVGGISLGVGIALLSSSHESAGPAVSIGPRTPLLRFSGTW